MKAVQTLRSTTFPLKLFVVTFIILLHSQIIKAQNPCDPITPIFNCNLSGQPNGTWISPAVPRAGNCCGTVPPDKCIEIIITLDSAAVAINFQIASGAVPPGALFYQIGCGPQIPVGSPICLNGPGPYVLTFCKPGNNINTYAITSIPGPAVSPDDTIGNGCSTIMYASGLLENSSITWTSIAPGPTGTYNSYLSCTSACDSTTVTGQPGAPAYVDYMVCGMPTAGACVSSGLYCDTIRIYFSPPILNVINPNPATFCANNTSGILLTGTVNGGVPPYTYAWTSGANGTGTVVGTGLSYTATTGGNYSFIVYDQNYPACPPQITNVPVTVSPAPVVYAGPDQSLCGTSVALNATVTGATGGIWSGGNGVFSPNNTTANATYTPTAAELAAGTLVLTWTSTGNGACTAVADQVIINIYPPVNVTLTAPSIICFGQTANITANATGGLAPYSYSWSTGQTSQTITNVQPGTFSLTVTTAGGVSCVATASVTIVSNPQIIVNTSPNNSISCSTTALISATASGGTGNLSYLWSNGATTQSTTVYSGTYVITVTDAVGCSAQNSVSVLAANSSLLASVATPSVLCNGATTTLNAIATGGFGSYTYAWSNGSTTSSTVVGAGNYCCTVTDGGGCITSACVTVSQNPLLTVNVPTPATICNGAAATITAYANGGQPAYAYNWNTGQNTQSVSALAGNYTVTVTDAIGCNTSAVVTVSQAPLLAVNVIQDPVGCFGGNNGSATANVSGGTQPYFYSWSPYGGSSSVATGLMAGNYTLTLTDAIGCSTNATVLVTQPQPLAATVTVNSNVSCNGGANGSAICNPSGGTSPYFYSWSPAGGTNQTAAGLTAGNYMVTVTDAEGCTQIAQTSITQPFPLQTNIATVTNVSCTGGNDGSATVSASGGTSPYFYSWAPTGGSSATANNLTIGNYTVTVSDFFGCSSQVSVSITQPTPLAATITSSTNVSCNGGNNGSATVTPSGGTAPYSYSWSTNPIQTGASAGNLTAGNYFVTVTDNEGCAITTSAVSITQPTVLTATATPNTFISCNTTVNISASGGGGTGAYTYLWSNGASTSSITVTTGTYSVIVTDGNGCTANSSVSVQASNSTLAASINQPPAICNGSTTTITVNPTGGFGSYTYQWSTGGTGPSIVTGAGNYCVTVTDGGGCIVSACVTITQNQPLTISIGTPQNICQGAVTTVTASGSGGQAPYNYLWSTSQITQSITQGAGTYTCTVSDATGSTCSVSATVTIAEEPAINLIMGSTNVSCTGGSNGSAIVYASGGMPGYTYSWSPFGGSNSSAYNLTPGTYSVNVMDNIGCLQTETVTITQPTSGVSIGLSQTNISCYGQNNGTATATGNGGASPYYYYWTPNGVSTTTLSGLTAGSYSVTVADSTGCYTSSSVSITEPADISLSASTVASTCGNSNASATVTASGGIPGYSYSWSPQGGTQNTATNISPGNYTVTVTDTNGCQKQLALNVPAVPFNLNSTFSASSACLNSPTSFTDFSTAGSDSIISWSWNFGEPPSGFTNTSSLQNPTHTYATVGTYTATLIISTAIGCSDTFSTTVTVNPLPVVAFASSSTCANSTTQFINSSSISSGSISTWAWNFGDPASGANNASALQNPVHVYTTAGSYTVILSATSNNGCVGTATQNLVINSPPVSSFTATSVCKNTPSQFTDASTVTNDVITDWSWNFGDGTTPDTLQHPLHNYASAGTFSVILTVTTASGCQDDDTLSVTVYSPAIPNFTAPDVCLNLPTQFTNSTQVPSGTVTSWAWDFGNFTPINNFQSPNYIYSAPGTFTVTLTVTTSNGCISTVSNPVTVYPLPIANFSNTTICQGSPTQFTDLSTVVNDSIVSWLWAYGDGSPVNNTQNPSHVYTVAGPYNTSLVVTSSNGCKDTVLKPITVNALPIAQFVVVDSNGCATYCTQFIDASVANSGGITNWVWSFGDGSPSGATASENHCYSQSGLYTISLTVTNTAGCTSTNTQVNLITVYPVPTANFSLSPQPTNSFNADIYFTDLSIDATAWAWNFGDASDVTPSYVQNPTHFYSDTGYFCTTLTVENVYHCFDTDTQCLRIEPEFTFYIPNAFTPESSEGTNDDFSGYGTFISQYDMWIFDRWGNMIFHTNDLNRHWDGRANGGKNIAQQDVYVYVVELYDFRGNKHKYKGTVTLVR
jgi:gliding motility-associated-like protein